MDKTKLIVKNLPNTNQDTKNFLKSKSGAVSVKSYGRCRVLLRFVNEITASFAIGELHQQEFAGRILSVEYLGNRKPSPVPTDQSEEPLQSLSSFIKDLYATSVPHGFEQPPPPYLKYNYPPINRTILDSISIALLTNTKFYQQVLHLMNRMNMEPPFLPSDKPFIPPGEPCDAQTQTDLPVEDTTKNSLLASDESELASDEEQTQVIVAKKRKKNLDEEVIRNKVRKIIHSQIHEKPHQPPPRKEMPRDGIFEGETRNVVKKISLNISAVKLPEDDNGVRDHVLDSQTGAENTPLSNQLVGDDLSLNRIPENQLKDLPLFKNYQRGERSNKLYIKNLSKDVSEKDLEEIYCRFVSSEKDISVKLMLFGKMKGQAFVTFLSVGNNYDSVERALEETNGYILKSKPMVVCFGKKS